MFWRGKAVFWRGKAEFWRGKAVVRDKKARLSLRSYVEQLEVGRALGKHQVRDNLVGLTLKLRRLYTD